jgi:hypothetical protein
MKITILPENTVVIPGRIEDANPESRAATFYF